MKAGHVKVVGARLDDEDWAMLQDAVRREKLTVSEVVRRAVRHYHEWIVSQEGRAD